ncbi:MAG: hypothetical protein FWD37_04495 [Methanomassiliicoccaceae archaeon]|nr:hypothetical protein [Methanomassiliicoccaceae archaeon]
MITMTSEIMIMKGEITFGVESDRIEDLVTDRRPAKSFIAKINTTNKNVVQDHTENIGDTSIRGFAAEKRKITIDSNVIIASVFSKRVPDESTSQRVIIKCKTCDIPILTDIIVDECLKRARKPNSKTSTQTMKEKLNNISPSIIELKPIPSVEELMKKYNIRDKRDLKILYSADKTDSVILITQDKDFLTVSKV